jgi:hypothetical protein
LSDVVVVSAELRACDGHTRRALCVEKCTVECSPECRDVVTYFELVSGGVEMGQVRCVGNSGVWTRDSQE